VLIRRLKRFNCVAVIVVLASSYCALAESPGSHKNSSKNVANKTATTPFPEAGRLVREVVYNELQDHDMHGYWRYWVQEQSLKETHTEERVETHDGPIATLRLTNGGPLTVAAREAEERRLDHLLSSPSEQAEHRKEYADDEHRIGRILALLPDAFLYEPSREEGKSQEMPDCPCYHLRFHPNPDYPAHSIESRIFHAMSGDLWISIESKHLVRLDGKLQENVDFGYGLLGRLYKDGWFQLERTRVGSDTGKGDWKTQRLEVHMQGRAMLFKTIARETSEVRGGFRPVPSGLSLQQAAALVRQQGGEPASQTVALTTAR
jgi:hypothetical protein